MTENTAPSTKPSAKRSKGRPVAGDNDVGRDRLLAATINLLKTLPPARVTISRIAQEAGTDPALVRYYFGDRTKLLMAVADRVTANAPHTNERTMPPEAALVDHIAKTMRLVQTAPFMHRLMIEELTDNGTEDTRTKARDMNVGLVDFYRELLTADGGEHLREVDPLFLHLLILGASDFFVSADSLVSQVVAPGTDKTELGERFQAFLVDVLLNGLRSR